MSFKDAKLGETYEQQREELMLNALSAMQGVTAISPDAPIETAVVGMQRRHGVRIANTHEQTFSHTVEDDGVAIHAVTRVDTVVDDGYAFSLVSMRNWVRLRYGNLESAPANAEAVRDVVMSDPNRRVSYRSILTSTMGDEEIVAKLSLHRAQVSPTDGKPLVVSGILTGMLQIGDETANMMLLGHVGEPHGYSLASLKRIITVYRGMAGDLSGSSSDMRDNFVTRKALAEKTIAAFLREKSE